MGHSEDQLETCCAAADDGDDARAIRRQRAGLDIVPAGGEGCDGFDRDCVLAGTVEAGDVGADADVDGEEVVGERGAVAQQDAFGGAVDADGFAVNESGVGEGGEAHGIHVDVVVGVVAGDVAGEHAGIRGFEVFGHECDADAGLGAHAEAFKYLDVSMTRAQQDEIGGDGSVRFHFAASQPGNDSASIQASKAEAMAGPVMRSACQAVVAGLAVSIQPLP